MRVTPFGKHNLAITDGKYYINNLIFMKNLLLGKENIFYSFKNGIGGNEWSILAWGGFSIGGILSIFGNIESMPTVFTWICVVNISISGLSMYVLMRYIKIDQIVSYIFSTSYALIGFNIIYCHEILFFLGPQLLPIIVLGLLKLLNEETPIIYIISLSICTFFNFYFSFHIVVFTIIVFIAYAIEKRVTKNRIDKIIVYTYIFSTIIAAGIASPMWLPALKAYTGGGRLNQTVIYEFTFDENMPFLHIFSKLFTGSHSLNEMINGYPNIYCGIIIVALVILYYINANITKIRKYMTTTIIVIYLLSFYINAFTLIMHGGTHTNWFPYRYSYVFSFLLICIAAEQSRSMYELSLENIKYCWIILILSVISIFSVKYEFISGGNVLIDLILLLAMTFAFWLYKNKSENASQNMLSVLLLILVSINLYANFVISINKMQEWELDLEQYNKDTQISATLIDAIKDSDNTIYRIEKDKSESGTVGADPYLYDYNGISHSGPAERTFIHNGLNRLAVNWFDMRHWYCEGIPAATDSLLGIKYLLSERNLAEEKNYDMVAEFEGMKVYENNVPLEIAIISDKNIKDLKLSDNAFDNLNMIWKTMAGEKDDIFIQESDVTFTMHNALEKSSITSNEIKESVSTSEYLSNTQDEISPAAETYIQYSFIASHDGPAYFFDSSIPSSGTGISIPSIKYCGYCKTGTLITGKIEVPNVNYITKDFLRGYCAGLVFAYSNNNVLAQYANKLNCRKITFEVNEETDIKGTFTADSEQCILFTLPWDEGWSCFIDGKRTKINKTCDLFMSVNVPEGTHVYELKFIPAWLNYGMIACGFSLVGLVILLVTYKRMRKAVDSPDNACQVLEYAESAVAGNATSDNLESEIEKSCTAVKEQVPENDPNSAKGEG